MSGSIRSGRQTYHGSLWAAQAVKAHFDTEAERMEVDRTPGDTAHSLSDDQ